jgi:hypothetical protein
MTAAAVRVVVQDALKMTGASPQVLGRAREILGRWVEFYNTRRLHAALNYLPPAECCAGDPEARIHERKEKLEKARKHREMINRARLQAAA